MPAVIEKEDLVVLQHMKDVTNNDALSIVRCFCLQSDH